MPPRAASVGESSAPGADVTKALSFAADCIGGLMGGIGCARRGDSAIECVAAVLSDKDRCTDVPAADTAERGDGLGDDAPDDVADVAADGWFELALFTAAAAELHSSTAARM